MSVVTVHRGSSGLLYVGTQYVGEGKQLTLGDPTYIDLNDAAFSRSGNYALFYVADGAAGIAGGESTVSRIVVVGTYAGRSVVKVGGNDASWDAATRTIQVKLS